MLHYIYIRGNHKAHQLSVMIRKLIVCEVITVNSDIYRNTVDISLGTDCKLTMSIVKSLHAYADSLDQQLFID